MLFSVYHSLRGRGGSSTAALLVSFSQFVVWVEICFALPPLDTISFPFSITSLLHSLLFGCLLSSFPIFFTYLLDQNSVSCCTYYHITYDAHRAQRRGLREAKSVEWLLPTRLANGRKQRKFWIVMTFFPFPYGESTSTSTRESVSQSIQ